jgi:hypothetical protein
MPFIRAKTRFARAARNSTAAWDNIHNIHNAVHSK